MTASHQARGDVGSRWPGPAAARLGAALGLALAVLVGDGAPAAAQVATPTATAAAQPDCAAVAGNLVQDCGFEAPALVPGATARVTGPATFPAGATQPWSVPALRNVDLVTSARWNTNAGRQMLDLNGASAGTVVQDVPTQPGFHYRVSFALAANLECSGDKTLTVAFGAASLPFTFVVTGRTARAMGWSRQVLTAGGAELLAPAAGTTTRLTITSMVGSQCGPAIDDVVVTAEPDPTATPTGTPTGTPTPTATATHLSPATAAATAAATLAPLPAAATSPPASATAPPGPGAPLPNRRPAARDDAARTGQGTPVAVAVTANDGDPDDDPLVVKEVRQPPNGAVTCAAVDPAAFRKQWACTYTPAPGFAGTDTFAYTLADPSGETSTAFVTVTVDPATPAPSPTPSATPSATLTVTPTATATPTPSATPTATPSAAPGAAPPLGAAPVDPDSAAAPGAPPPAAAATPAATASPTATPGAAAPASAPLPPAAGPSGPAAASGETPPVAPPGLTLSVIPAAEGGPAVYRVTLTNQSAAAWPAGTRVTLAVAPPARLLRVVPASPDLGAVGTAPPAPTVVLSAAVAPGAAVVLELELELVAGGAGGQPALSATLRTPPGAVGLPRTGSPAGDAPVAAVGALALLAAGTGAARHRRARASIP